MSDKLAVSGETLCITFGPFRKSGKAFPAPQSCTKLYSRLRLSNLLTFKSLPRAAAILPNKKTLGLKINPSHDL